MPRSIMNVMVDVSISKADHKPSSISVEGFHVIIIHTNLLLFEQ